MSVNAHRQIMVKFADYISFSLWKNQVLVDFLASENDGGFWNQLGDGGTGHVVVEMEALRKALQKATELNLTPETVKALRQDIKAAERAQEETVTYDCF